MIQPEADVMPILGGDLPVIGGLKNDPIVVVQGHLLDADLKKILTTLNSEILRRYRQAKHLTDSSDDSIQFQPHSYTTQVVAGTNFFLKLEVVHKDTAPCSPKEYIHVRIFDQPWTQTLELTGLKINVQANDPFQYDFEPFPETK
ncbi:hypothetical protein BG011_008112 [Mortierella polycephala]|uniref:Cystatin domain-containing protein n=1 Tax=Mortierella polycephala TaxID=41804 RepID=A0A9P6PNN7_9FUNG|nr:hypothetical protein BG011_008112 [Mortierella polycephala]